MSALHAIGECVGIAVASITAVFIIHGKDLERPPKVIYWTGEVKHGFSVMEEDVTEQYALVWYHGGWPTYQWMRRQ